MKCSKEHKEKIRLSNLGKSRNKGRILTEAHKQKMSQRFSKEKNPMFGMFKNKNPNYGNGEKIKGLVIG